MYCTWNSFIFLSLIIKQGSLFSRLEANYSDDFRNTIRNKMKGNLNNNKNITNEDNYSYNYFHYSLDVLSFLIKTQTLMYSYKIK